MPAKARPKKNLSAMKRARQNVKRNLRNKSVLSSVKTGIKKVEDAIVSGDREAAGKALHQAIRGLTKAVSKGALHKNTVSRKISRLTKQVNSLQPQADVPATGAA